MARFVMVAVMAAAACVAVGGSRSAISGPLTHNGLIVFASDRGTDRGGEVYTVRVSTGRVRNVSHSRSADTEPVVAPGGRRVGFFSRRTGFWALYVEYADGTGLRRASKSLGTLAYPPDSLAWAPDGKAIACHADAAPCVSRPGQKIRLVATGRAPSWSADGTLIASSSAGFPQEVVVTTRDGDELWRTPGFGPHWSPRGQKLALIAPDGATEIVDASGATLVTFAGFSFDSWSPDGRSILSNDLAIGDARTGTVSRVLHGFGGRWSPDSRRLAFSAYEDGRLTSRLAGPKGGQPRTLASFGPLLGWSPDGRWILLGHDSAGSGVGTGIFVVRADGSHLRRLARTPAGSKVSGAAWAAGGRRVVFRRETQGALYTIRADGRSLRRLTSGGYGDSTPAWSPDGRSLAFARSPEPSRSENLFVQRVVPARGRARVLLRCFGCRSPAWSPDGGRIAFAGLGYGIYTLRIGDAEAALVASGYDPDWSPSGEQLAFTGRFGGVVVTGAGVVAEQGAGPAWSPDGQWIAYSGPGGIHTVHPDGTGDELLVAGGAGSVAWSPDGRRLVFAEHGDLYVVGAAGGGRRRLTSGAATDMTPDWQPLP
jgi:Tol biopolymer transport system component